MEVYVLVVSWQFDSGECGEYCHVYETIEKAKAAMEHEIKLAKQDFRDAGIEDVETSGYAAGDCSWSIWEEGEYCYNHEDINIYCREVE